jgi:hypothetical protein
MPVVCCYSRRCKGPKGPGRGNARFQFCQRECQAVGNFVVSNRLSFRLPRICSPLMHKLGPGPPPKRVPQGPARVGIGNLGHVEKGVR